MKIVIVQVSVQSEVGRKAILETRNKETNYYAVRMG